MPKPNKVKNFQELLKEIKFLILKFQKFQKKFGKSDFFMHLIGNPVLYYIIYLFVNTIVVRTLFVAVIWTSISQEDIQAIAITVRTRPLHRP